MWTLSSGNPLQTALWKHAYLSLIAFDGRTWSLLNHGASASSRVYSEGEDAGGTERDLCSPRGYILSPHQHKTVLHRAEEHDPERRLGSALPPG